MPSADLRRRAGAVALLLLVYVGLSFLLDDRGYLGADTGAKVATLDQMVEGGRWSPWVTYWADDLDPSGDVIPFYQAEENDDGHWVAVTTVPMLLAGRPLYDLGGLRLSLLLPMVGGVGAAGAAAALARRLGAADGGRSAFWVVGLASPITIYALDFWEHSIGVALVAWGVVFLHDVLDAPDRHRAAVLAGGAFGLAATMRTESLIYAAAAVGATAIVLWRRHGLATTVRVGALVAAPAAVVLAANAAVESVLGATSRVARAGGAVAAAGGTSATAGAEAPTRLGDAVQTTVGIDGTTWRHAAVLGLVVVAGLVMATRAAGHDRRLAIGGIAVAAAVLLVEAADGLGFVPGLLVATPLAVVGLVVIGSTTTRRWVAAAALLPVPVVWATQYLGGAAPQWGGRYLLTTGLLLVVLALSAGSAVVPPFLRAGAVGVSALVTLTGVAFQVQRTHEFGSYFDDVLDQPEDVVVAVNAFLPREAGARVDDARFLAAGTRAAALRAGSIARDAGACRIGVIGWRRDPPLAERFGPTAALVEVRPLDLFDTDTGFAVYDLCS